MDSIRVISYNVKGLHNPIKRKKILNELKHLKCTIAFIQESHLSDSEHMKLKKSWASQVYFSSHGSGRRRGVAILLHSSLQFCLHSEITDKEGRFILVNGSICGAKVSMLNIYAPNESNPNFFKKICEMIIEKSKGIFLIGGDFNCILSNRMDKNPPSFAMPSGTSRILKQMMEDLGLIDAWRHIHPRDRDYTFYSNPHSSYSRIDYFFVAKNESYRVLDCKIHNITLSDHAPVSLIWDLGRCYNPSLWRLNVSLLNDNAFKDYIKVELDQYLLFNDTSETSPGILWEAAKAVLRGRIISFASAKARLREAKRKELEEQIKQLEQRHKSQLSTSDLTQLNEARRALGDLLTDNAERNLRFLKQRYYEHGSRASKLLAFQLKKQMSLTVVQKIKNNDPDKPFLYKPDEISGAFATFYKKLYSNMDTCTEFEKIYAYLESINLPKLSDEDSQAID